MLKKVAWGGTVLVALLAVLVVAAVLWVRTALPDREGVVALEGLTGPVDVFFDSDAVPHVWGGSMEDAAFAQGYLHARDRLWQMELIRRAVEGRLAEVMGDGALTTDVFMRRTGLWRAAAAAEPLLAARERRLLEAYSAGVNAWLRTRTGALPPEFLALRYEPEPWRPVHSLASAKMLSLTLASYYETVSVARGVRRLSVERARHLFPEFPDWGTTILEAPDPPDPPPLAAALIDRFSIAAASNAWAISGERTASGKPLLANDPHLDLQAPGLWYLMGLHAATADSGRALDVVGATLPSIPLVILGHNRAVAWGATNAYVDDTDLFIEVVDPTDEGRYLVPGGSEPFGVRVDTIRVKGREEPELLEVRTTRHGPVLPFDDRASGDTVLALRWTALEPLHFLRGVVGANLARDWHEVLAAAETFQEPHQNLVYADTAGHIGYIMVGSVPLRGDRRPATVVPRPGWTGDWDWTGTLPFAEHPRVLDPPSGYVVTANNRQTVAPIADLISRTWMPPFRAERITQMIEGAGAALTAEDVHAMQLDLLDLEADRYAVRAIEAAGVAGLEEAAADLRAWDRRATPESTVAPLYYVWKELVRRAASRDLYGGDPGYFPVTALGAVLEAGALPWAEEPEAAFDAISVAAIRRAAELTAGDRWEDANRAVHRHALGGVAFLDRLLGLNVGPDPHYGAPATVNVAHWAFGSPDDDYPFTTDAGPSLRHVADMGNLDRAGGFVIGTGQSGIPFSRHYDDQRDRWREGGLIPLPLTRDAVEREAAVTMRLEPAGHDRP